MSAIAGACCFEDECEDLETTVRKMTAAMADLGSVSETFVVDRHVAFGHRLSCFTPEDRFEKQPLASRDGCFLLVCAGRIDNRAELAEALRISAAAQMPDSAFVLAAFQKWGEDFAGHLVGAFAAAVYDKPHRTLTLARSPGGEQSLFWWSDDGRRLLFASAPRALFATGAVARRVNLQTTADFLVTLRDNRGGSWYRDVESLKPGTMLSVDRRDLRGPRIWRYWRPEEIPELRYRKDSDYVEAFQELWRTVIADNLRSASARGILMSGGLDSTGVAATAALELAKRGETLSAFTEVPPEGFAGELFPGRYADETPYVQTMARRFPNLDLTLVRTPSCFFLDGVEDWFRAAEAPFRNGFNRLWWHLILRTAARRGISVLLTGTGGNLSTAWDGANLMHDLILQGRWAQAAREARAFAANGSSPSFFNALSGGLLPFLPEPLWVALNRVRHKGDSRYSANPAWDAYSFIRPEFAREQRIAERAREVGQSMRFRPSRPDRCRVLQWNDAQGDYRRGELSLHGAELRDAPLDRRIVEFTLAVPEDQFRRNGESRWLFRRAMREMLPAEILNHPKRGLQAANWRDQLVAGGGAMAELEALERSPLACHVLDLAAMRRLHAHAENDSGYHSKLCMGFMTGRFLRWTETAA